MRHQNFPGCDKPPAPVVSGHLFYRVTASLKSGWGTPTTDATWQSMYQTFSAQGIILSGYYSLTGGPHPLTITAIL